MATQKKPPLLPDAAYENAHLISQDLLERLREFLFSLPALGSDHVPIKWAGVGDVMRSTSSWTTRSRSSNAEG